MCPCKVDSKTFKSLHSGCNLSNFDNIKLQIKQKLQGNEQYSNSTVHYIVNKCNQHNGETTIANFIVTLKLSTVDLHKITALLYVNEWAQAGRMDQMVGDMYQRV